MWRRGCRGGGPPPRGQGAWCSGRCCSCWPAPATRKVELHDPSLCETCAWVWEMERAVAQVGDGSALRSQNSRQSACGRSAPQAEAAVAQSRSHAQPGVRPAEAAGVVAGAVAAVAVAAVAGGIATAAGVAVAASVAVAGGVVAGGMAI